MSNVTNLTAYRNRRAQEQLYRDLLAHDIFIESLPSIDYFTPKATTSRKIEINAPAATSERLAVVVYLTTDWRDKPCDTE